jgi:hypothetical protein
MMRRILVGSGGILWFDEYMMELKLVPDTAHLPMEETLDGLDPKTNDGSEF